MPMLNLVLVILLFVYPCGTDRHFPWSAKLTEKVNATVSSTFGGTTDYALNEVNVTTDIEGGTTRTIEHNLYKITQADSILGYVFVDQTPSMKNVFDFAVVLDSDLKVKKAKVLIYREQHGRQIGTKRWLQQFTGLTSADRPTLGEDVDGISGATISATSMTDAIRELLQDIAYLESKDFF